MSQTALTAPNPGDAKDGNDNKAATAAVDAAAPPSVDGKHPDRETRQDRSRSRGRRRDRSRGRRRRSRSPVRDDRRRRRRSRSRDRRRKRRRRSPGSGSESSDEYRERRRQYKQRESGWDKAPLGPNGLPLPAPPGMRPGFPPHMAPPGMFPRPGPPNQRQARRLYIGSINPVLQEAEGIDFFNRMIRSCPERKMAPAQSAPVVELQINYQKSFAFLTLLNEEDANIALCLDEYMYKGQLPLKIRRPKDYIPPPGPPPKTYHIPGIISGKVPNGPDKLFLGNLPQGLEEKEIQQLLVAYGALKGFHMVRDPNTGQPRGYCFFAYADPAVTEDACKGLNGIEILNNKLLCQHASAGRAGSGMGPGMGPPPAGFPMMGLGPPPIPGMPGIPGIPGLPPGVPASVQETPTRILVLMNMVTPEELNDPEEYQDIKADIGEECKKFGQIRDLHIPRSGEPGCGRVIVAYDAVEGAKRANDSIRGRKFADRTILTHYLSEEKYEKKAFDA